MTTPTPEELHVSCSHPGFEYITTDGPRKTWSAADKPPPGEGWERNVDRGRSGWERFSFHEESYWRRRKSEFMCAWEDAGKSDQVMHFIDNCHADIYTALCGAYVPVRRGVWTGPRCEVCEGIRLMHFGETP